MKKCQQFFALLCTLGTIVAGLSLVTYAGPCYVNSGTVLNAIQKGCSETWFGPAGLSCPGMVSLENNGGPVTSCSFRRIEREFSTGTSGNEQSGRMEQGNIERPCFSYQYCTLYSSWVPALPLGVAIIYKCLESEKADGYATQNGWEAKGADCPEDPEDTTGA